ncbi:MAG: alpha-hydroxy-acid oxidizing protein [Erysipelotrichales bacterium]|nr:MAG: alpha-hydroxy-acid oxidizing protein [Erysipelotrichales bacterium]
MNAKSQIREILWTRFHAENENRLKTAELNHDILKDVTRRYGMNLNDIKSAARGKMTLCKMCRVCNGETCRGLTPGPGGKGSGQTFVRNVEKLKDITLNMRVLHNDDNVDCTLEFFGQTLKAPIFAAPIAKIKANYGTSFSEIEYLEALSAGCATAGLLPFYGDGVQSEFFDLPLEFIKKHKGFGVPTIKPWINEITFEKIMRANEVSPVAIAMDVDAAGLISLKQTSTPIAFKHLNDLLEIRSKINGPFIIKGVMTVKDAELAILAHADAIIVSNHGGRVMDDGISTIEVLSEIASFVAHRALILTDGGYRSGYDVFKALACGADGVLVGRPFSHAAIGGNAEGVALYAKQLIAELEDAMRMTGCFTLKDIQRTNINLHF